MHTTISPKAVTLDEALLARAEQLCADLERSALLREALRALVQRESTKPLAARIRGGSPVQKPFDHRSDENPGVPVRELMAQNPERSGWIDELAELLSLEEAVDLGERPDAPWPTGRWETVLTEIDWMG